jgi:ribosomal protein L37AE/L43A
MYKKNCQRCSRASFSSTEAGEWICPSCGNDLTASPFFQATSFLQINQKVVPLEKKLKVYSKTFPLKSATVRQKTT